MLSIVHLIGTCAMESAWEGFLAISFRQIDPEDAAGFLGPAARYCSEDRRGFSGVWPARECLRRKAERRAGSVPSFLPDVWQAAAGNDVKNCPATAVQAGASRGNRQNSYEFSASGDTQLRQTGDRCCHRILRINFRLEWLLKRFLDFERNHVRDAKFGADRGHSWQFIVQSTQIRSWQ